MSSYYFYNDNSRGVSSDYSFGVGIFASTRSGKTYLLNYLLKHTHLSKYAGCLFSTSLAGSAYDQIRRSDKLSCRYEFSPLMIEEMQKLNKKVKLNGSDMYYLLNILDDENSAKDSSTLKKALSCHRNSNFINIVSTQAYSFVAKSCRANFNYVFFGAFTTDEACENIMKVWLGSYFPGIMEEKIEQYRDLTSDHWFLFLNNFTGQLYRFKAK